MQACQQVKTKPFIVFLLFHLFMAHHPPDTASIPFCQSQVCTGLVSGFSKHSENGKLDPEKTSL